MRVLIVAGPHKGESIDARDGQHYVDLVDPYTTKIVFRGQPSVIAEPELSVTNYRIHAFRLGHPEWRFTEHVAVPVANDTSDGAVMRTTLNYLFNHAHN